MSVRHASCRMTSDLGLSSRSDQQSVKSPVPVNAAAEIVSFLVCSTGKTEETNIDTFTKEWNVFKFTQLLCVKCGDKMSIVYTRFCQYCINRS